MNRRERARLVTLLIKYKPELDEIHKQITLAVLNSMITDLKGEKQDGNMALFLQGERMRKLF